MKNIRGQARRGQEGLGERKRAQESEREHAGVRERMEKGERKREETGKRRISRRKIAFPEGESALLLSLSSRLSKDVSFLLFSLFIFSYRSRLHNIAFNVSFKADKGRRLLPQL